MSDETAVVMEDGTENRTISWGVTAVGRAYIRETSAGDMTELAFDAAERETTVTFDPTDDYTLADVADTVERHADDCYITDFEDALTLWGVPFTIQQRTVLLVA